MIIIGSLLCLFMSLTEVSLSDDIYRYLFNGHIARNGLNPYFYAPDMVGMADIIASFPYYDLINNPMISDPYPPLMLVFTYIITFFTGNSLILWRLVTSGVFLFSAIFIRKLLILFELNPNYTVLWIWNPLFILEFSHSGHNDIFAIFFILLGIYFLKQSEKKSNNYNFFAGISWALAISLKLFPILVIIFFIKKLKTAGIGGLVIGLGGLILTGLILGRYNTTGLEIFLMYWRFNGGFYEFSSLIIKAFQEYLFNNILSISEVYIQSRLLFIFIGIIIYGLIILTFFKQKEAISLEKSLFYSGNTLFVLLLLSPVLHPWYVIWMAIFFILNKEKPFFYSFLILSGNVLLSYYFYACICEDLFVLVLEYVPVYILLLIELFKLNSKKVLSDNV